MTKVEAHEETVMTEGSEEGCWGNCKWVHQGWGTKCRVQEEVARGLVDDHGCGS